MEDNTTKKLLRRAILGQGIFIDGEEPKRMKISTPIWIGIILASVLAATGYWLLIFLGIAISK